jgi:alcohol dehydrogenase class IV
MPAAFPDDFVFVHSNRRLIHGWGAVEKLKALAEEAGCRKAAVVLDGFFLGQPISAKLSDLLTLPGGKPALIGVPTHEPDTGTIEACRDALAASGADFIVGLGGGSAMDTAKIARMLLSNPGPAEGIAGFGKKLAPHASLFVCVPTTAGTGSEVSESAIAGKAGSDVKLIFRSQDMTPQIALLDPELTVSCPARVTAQSGYDAITHAVEAYVSRMSGPMTDPFAHSAFALLARWLPLAVAEPTNRAARSWCLIASAQAAIAFNSANLGLAHAFAAPLGALHHVPHGLGNALALPVVTAFNEPALGDKAAVIAGAFGARSAAEAMAKARHAVGLDLSLDAYVPDADARERVAQAASRSGQMRMNPRQAEIGDLRAMLEAMRTPTGAAAPAFSR